jgi:hypothetical protein
MLSFVFHLCLYDTNVVIGWDTSSAIRLCLHQSIGLLCQTGVIYLHAINKVAGYAHATKKFPNTCVPCT